MNNVWELFLKTNKSNLTPEVIDYIAVSKILFLACQGYSNTRISRKLDVPAYYVFDVLVEFLNFTGWESDLDFSPWAIYKNCEDNFYMFVGKVSSVSAYQLSDRVLSIAFNICREFIKIKNKIEISGYIVER